MLWGDVQVMKVFEVLFACSQAYAMLDQCDEWSNKLIEYLGGPTKLYEDLVAA